MRIMFVCHGNICRSPMAEMIFSHMLAERGVSGVEVASSATSTEEIYRGVGSPVYPPALRELRRHGIPTWERRAVQLTAADYGRYDLFLLMDGRNLRGISAIFPTDPEGKVKRLLDYAGGGDVADPWYTGNFEAAYSDIYRGCEALLRELIDGGTV